jgi:hypothetical protein
VQINNRLRSWIASQIATATGCDEGRVSQVKILQIANQISSQVNGDDANVSQAITQVAQSPSGSLYPKQ